MNPTFLPLLRFSSNCVTSIIVLGGGSGALIIQVKRPQPLDVDLSPPKRKEKSLFKTTFVLKIDYFFLTGHKTLPIG